MDFYEYLKKTAGAIGEQYITDRLDYQRQKRLLALTPAAAPQQTPQASATPKWIMPTVIGLAVILAFLVIRRKANA